MTTLDDIRERIDKGDDTQSIITSLTEYISENPRDDEAYTLRGMRYWSLGERAKAINDYMAAVKLNPRSRAGQLIKASYEILNYYNKDLLNP